MDQNRDGLILICGAATSTANNPINDDDKTCDHTPKPVDPSADTVAPDDTNKVEKLTKAGRGDLDLDEGSD